MSDLISLGLNTPTAFAGSSAVEPRGRIVKLALKGATAGLIALQLVPSGKADAQTAAGQPATKQVDHFNAPKVGKDAPLALPMNYSLKFSEFYDQAGNPTGDPYFNICDRQNIIGQIQAVNPPDGPQDKSQQWEYNVVFAANSNAIVAATSGQTTYNLLSPDGKKATWGRSLLLSTPGQPDLRVFRSDEKAPKYFLLVEDSTAPNGERTLAKGQLEHRGDTRRIELKDLKGGILASVSWQGLVGELSVSQVRIPSVSLHSVKQDATLTSEQQTNQQLGLALFGLAGTAQAWEIPKQDQSAGQQQSRPTSKKGAVVRFLKEAGPLALVTTSIFLDGATYGFYGTPQTHLFPSVIGGPGYAPRPPPIILPSLPPGSWP